MITQPKITAGFIGLTDNGVNTEFLDSEPQRNAKNI